MQQISSLSGQQEQWADAPHRAWLSGYRVSVVIPTLNEAKNLPHVLPHIPREVDEVILVDGSSTDETVQVAQDLLPHLRVVQEEGHGKGAALRTGFKAATGDIIIMLDADGSTDPAEIPAFVGALLAGPTSPRDLDFSRAAARRTCPSIAASETGGS